MQLRYACQACLSTKQKISVGLSQPSVEARVNELHVNLSTISQTVFSLQANLFALSAALSAASNNNLSAKPLSYSAAVSSDLTEVLKSAVADIIRQ